MYMFTPLETILVCNLKKNYLKTDLLKEFLTGQEAPFGGPAQIVEYLGRYIYPVRNK